MALYSRLDEKLPDLRYKETKEMCSLFVEGQRRFAYVSHRIRTGNIHVWVLGSAKCFLSHNAGQMYVQHERAGIGWRDFHGPFELTTIADVEVAAQAMLEISVPYAATSLLC